MHPLPIILLMSMAALVVLHFAVRSLILRRLRARHPELYLEIPDPKIRAEADNEANGPYVKYMLGFLLGRRFLGLGDSHLTALCWLDIAVMLIGACVFVALVPAAFSV